VYIFSLICGAFNIAANFDVIETWHIQNIPLNRLTVIKEIPVQAVYKAESCYIKIWNSNALQFLYNRHATFLKAVQNGVFQDIAPLIAVIMNNDNQCCGYATKICSPVAVNIAALRADPLSAHTDNDSRLVIDLFKRMRERTLKTDFCFTDLADVNLGILEERCYFIDLDGFWDLGLYKKTHDDWQSALFYLDKKYS
jgi:hypothetical protein